MAPRKPSAKKSSRKLTHLTASTSLAELAATKDASRKKHGKAKLTTDKYDQQLRQAQRWLAALVESEAALETPQGCPDSLGDKPSWNSDELAHAFDKQPNRASAGVLALYIAFMCFDIGNGKATAYQIHSAFIKMWDKADSNGMWRGLWIWDEERGVGRGNPARAAEVKELIHAVKHQEGAEGTRSHSCAMKMEYMEKITDWSTRQCPSSMSEDLAKNAEYWAILPRVLKHFLMCAFATSGFTLWTRNFELVKLQFKHLTLDVQTDDGFKFPHFLVSLENQKNWQHNLSRENVLHGHNYEIHPQPELPAIDMHHHFLQWIQFLQKYVYSRGLRADDYIFPSIGSNGIAQPGKPLSHDTVQKWLDEFVDGAGIKLGKGRLTTHCLRRGGAQYRFMYAPIGKRWSLTVIRWWGGWAEGEHHDTLIRYLLDELYYYEEGHGDALRPISREADKSFLGEHTEMRPATKQEVREMMRAQMFTLQENLVETCREALQSSTITQSPGPSLPLLRRGEYNVRIGDTQPGPFHFEPNAATSSDSVQNSPSTPHDLRIPSLPRHGELHLRWKQVVRDWEEPDPKRGHHVALKDWSPKWLKENREVFGTKYGKRKLLALEYIEGCQRNDDLFLKKWPQAREGASKALEAIHKQRLATGAAKPRKSKNGSPTERAKARV